jgi:hypothetical protein
MKCELSRTRALRWDKTWKRGTRQRSGNGDKIEVRGGWRNLKTRDTGVIRGDEDPAVRIRDGDGFCRKKGPQEWRGRKTRRETTCMPRWYCTVLAGICYCTVVARDRNTGTRLRRCHDWNWRLLRTNTWLVKQRSKSHDGGRWLYLDEMETLCMYCTADFPPVPYSTVTAGILQYNSVQFSEPS